MTHLARTTDPDTSREAAESLQPCNVHLNVLQILQSLGPLIDDQLVQTYHLDAYAYGWYDATPQRIRTARHELVERGQVRATGGTRKTRTGRKSQLWEVTP